MKSFILLASLFFFLFFPSQLFAAEQFAEGYTVRYEIQENGDALVTEQVTIRNLTDSYFGSNYTSIVPTKNVADVSARDAFRALQVGTKEENGKTVITVNFPEQVIGKDKQYSWTLRYRLANFVQLQGSIKQFQIPRLTPIANLEKYDITVATPLSLGEPSQISPQPLSQKDVADLTEYSFDMNQIEQSSISSIFGTSQYYDFEQGFSLTNNGLLPAVQSVFVPTTGLYQEIIIDEISPRPENVVIDAQGNAKAFFKLDRLETKSVKVKGNVKLDLERNMVNVPAADELSMLTSANDVWDSNSPQVKKALEVALENQENLTVLEKGQKIYEYVISAIELGDYSQATTFMNKQSFSTSNSASSVLSDPKNRFCSDFVNVTIAMLRAAAIPAEQVVGFAYTNNDPTKPTCYTNDQDSSSARSQHTWVRFLDPQKGWVFMDPTWGAAGNGLTFFNSTDLSHISTAHLSEPEESVSSFAGSTMLGYSTEEFIPQFKLNPEVIAPQELISGFPYTITFRISNDGNTVLPPGSFKISANELLLKPKNSTMTDNEFVYPSIPPFGYVDYEFTTKSGLAWREFSDTLSFSIHDQSASKEVSVRPIFNSKFFSAIILGITFAMLSLYLLVLYLHYRSKTVVESAEEVVQEIAKVIAPVVPVVKISGSKVKSVVKEKKTKSQKFRRKRKTSQ